MKTNSLSVKRIVFSVARGDNDDDNMSGVHEQQPALQRVEEARCAACSCEAQCIVVVSMVTTTRLSTNDDEALTSSTATTLDSNNACKKNKDDDGTNLGCRALVLASFAAFCFGALHGVHCARTMVDAPG
jgi:hypothetical protein